MRLESPRRVAIAAVFPSPLRPRRSSSLSSLLLIVLPPLRRPYLDKRASNAKQSNARLDWPRRFLGPDVDKPSDCLPAPLPGHRCVHSVKPVAVPLPRAVPSPPKSIPIPIPILILSHFVLHAPAHFPLYLWCAASCQLWGAETDRERERGSEGPGSLRNAHKTRRSRPLSQPSPAEPSLDVPTNAHNHPHFHEYLHTLPLPHTRT